MLDEAVLPCKDREFDLVDIESALAELSALDARNAEIVELRFFGGLTMDEIAETTGRSKRTLHREWSLARAWLRRELGTPGDAAR